MEETQIIEFAKGRCVDEVVVGVRHSATATSTEPTGHVYSSKEPRLHDNGSTLDEDGRPRSGMMQGRNFPRAFRRESIASLTV